MRIVFIRSNPVDPYPRLEKTANSLISNGHEGYVLAWDRKEDYKKKESVITLKDSKIKVTRFGIMGEYGGGIKKNWKALLKFQFRILSWLIKNRNRYDVIHAYDFDTGFISLICAKLLRKKIVYDIPDYYIDAHKLRGTKVGNIIEKLECSIINSAEATIICTEKRKEQINKSNPKKLVIIHNSPLEFNTCKFNNFNNSNNKFKVVYVGILSNARFLKEITEVIINRDDCEFHVGGFGALEEYFKKISIKYSNIFFYGRLKYDKTLELESNCDIMTAIYDPKIPNHYYAAPNKFYEALMLGKPLIMIENTGMDNVIKENNLGEVIEFSKEDLSKAINKLIQRKNEWKQISERSKKIYKENYSWNKMNERLVELYKNI